MKKLLLLFAYLLTISSLHFAQFNQWVDAGNMLGERYAHTSTLLPNGKVLIVGNYLDKAELYDPVSDMFTAINTNFTRLYGSTATLLNDGKVLIVGGDNAQNQAELFDPATESFEIIDSLNMLHSFHTATLLNDGRVLIAGGQDQRSGPQTHAVCEIYNPLTGKFTLTDSLNVDRSSYSAVLLPDGRVLIIGGVQTTTPGSAIYINSCELYDPLTGTFTLTQSLKQPRQGLDATLLRNGKALVTCGAYYQKYGEIFDPVTETWSLTGDMTVMRRSNHTATILHNGKVLLVGGYVDYATPTAEIYDPATNSFTAIDSMKVPRAQHGATRLKDGSVLVSGGYNGITNVNSAERYLIDTSEVVSVREMNNFQGRIPAEYQLFQNYPNPFNPSTKISWQSPMASWQTLKIFDMLGHEVKTLVDEEKAAGSYEVEFQTADCDWQLASGIYYYQLKIGSFVLTKKMILMR